MSAASPDLELLRALASSRENYAAFRPFVKQYTVLPEAMPIIEDMGEWFEKHPAPTLDWPAFLAWARVHQHPSWKPERWDIYKTIAEGAAALPAYNAQIIERFREMDYAARIREHAMTALEKGGTPAIAEIATLVSAYQQAGSSSSSSPVTGGAAPPLSEMLDGLVRTDGLEWRIEDMNVSVGPLHRGDLVLVGARPEVGKTTFLCAEFTHMAAQLPEGKHAVIFNNEEIANKIRVRLVQSALGTTVSDLMADTAKAEAAYAKALNGRRIDVIHDTAMSTKDVERILKSGEYALIGFNIIDKITGFTKEEREVERLRRLGIWARGLADAYGVVFALAQADASAEGQRIINQSQLYNTKTGLVAETDAMLMIGKDNAPGMADQRWLNVVRNKMPGGTRSQPSLRHGVFQVEFDGERARFKSLAYKRATP